MELYRNELINFYTKVKQCTIQEASMAWKRATKVYDDTFYSIMTYMTTSEECKPYMVVMISRNPLINYLSAITMKVAHIKQDMRDKTMTIPSNICGTTNADFDGDVLNIFRLIGEDMIKRFAKSSDPLYNSYISRIDGKINKETIPFKDEACVFYQFNHL